MIKTQLLHYLVIYLLIAISGCSSDNKIENDLISLSSLELLFDNIGGEQSVIVTHNGEWSAIKTSSADWVNLAHNKLSESESTIKIIVEPNIWATDRTVDIMFSCGTVSQILKIKQEVKPSFKDGDYIQLKKATVGNGVNIVVLGDGFTIEDFNFNGRYHSLAEKICEYMFNIEPYQSYKECFNVYMVAAISDEAGIGNEIPGVKVRNKFGSTFGNNTLVEYGSTDTIVSYINKIPKFIAVDSEMEFTTIIFLNSSKIAGTAYMYDSGFSISLCSLGSNTNPLVLEGTIHHEVGGHAFGLLADEYAQIDRQIPANTKAYTEKRQNMPLKFYHNISFSNAPDNVWWMTELATLPKYSYLELNEGGCNYSKGVWKPEIESCMSNTIPYFNAPSRYLITNRILRLAGFPTLTPVEFMDKDKAGKYNDAKVINRISGFPAAPFSLHPPLFIEK